MNDINVLLSAYVDEKLRKRAAKSDYALFTSM
jgi:hypothetical protein